MNRDSLFIIVLTIFVVSIATKMFLESEAFNLKCIVSSENGNTYCVQERTKIHEVVDLLAKTSDKMEYLIEKLKVKYPQRENVKRLVDKCNPKKIMETLPSSKYTAYSENKGQKMAFCVTTEKSNNNLIDRIPYFSLLYMKWLMCQLCQ